MITENEPEIEATPDGPAQWGYMDEEAVRVAMMELEDARFRYF